MISLLVPSFFILWLSNYSFFGGGGVLVCVDCPLYLGSSMSLSVQMDSLSMTFGAVLCAVAYQAFSYCLEYMGSFAENSFFFLVLGIFIFSMELLIFSGDLFGTFLAWDGLGVSSFLLIAHYNKISAWGGALITAGVNRGGDAFLCVVLAHFFSGPNFLLGGVDSLSSVACFSLAAATKSAQWPFSVWLPVAMAAPTPISALVHSSTLVTAGIYLLLRGESFLGEVHWLGELGMFTFVVAGISASMTFDLKRLIAMSTLGHLGFMVACLGWGQTHLGVLHLFSHALFKSSLFMGAGDLIDCFGHSQDLRDMSQAWKATPLSTHGFFLSLVSLGGLPFTAGFMSKGAGLQAISVGATSQVGLGGFLGAMGLLFSSVYCFRCWYYLFWVEGSNPLWNDIEGNPVYSNNALGFAVGGLMLDASLGSFWGSSVDFGEFGVSASWEYSWIALGLGLSFGNVGGTPLSFSDYKSFHLTAVRAGYRALSSSVLKVSLLGLRGWEGGVLEVTGPQGVYKGVQSCGRKVGVSSVW